MTVLVTKHLPLVAGAPDGIKKLRALILELAVRGRLVDQDLSDEPALELLKRITEAKCRFDAGRSRRALPESPQASLNARPFQEPVGWVWTTFGAATMCRDGERVPVSQTDREGRAKVYDYYGASGVIDKIDHYLFDKPLLLIGEDGANLINRSTPIAFIARGRYWVNNHAHVIDGVSEAFLDYMALYINAIDLKPYVTGTAQPKMNQAKLNSIPVALPPEPEQKRIVAKVDELMALCDRLEADQADAEAAHAQLVQALLGSLTQATDAADFRASWQRVSEHFHTLFTTEASIDALKQAVLQLAVMGRLVPQLVTDPPAREFLRQNKITGFDHPHLRGWASTALGALGSVLGGATPSKANASYWIGDIPWVSPKDMKRAVIDDAEDHVSEAAVEGASLKVIPHKSLLMVVRGMILAHSFPVAVTARKVTINQDMKALVPPPEIADYLLTFLRASKTAIVGLVDRSSHGTCKLTSEKLWAFEVALPPLSEQHRIVAKVDELMALCDQLKSKLQAARQQHAQLASLLVEQVLA